MIWISMTIPEDPARLADWLEAQLVGQNLSRLIAELQAVHGDRAPTRSLEAILGKQAERVLESGLGVLSNAALRELLQNPSLLLELQERVLIEGGSYWSELPMMQEMSEALDRGWERLSRKIASYPPGTTPSTILPVQRRGLLRRASPYAITSLATAAAIVLAWFLFLFNQKEETAKTWGWQKPDAFPTNLSRTAYLNRLADEANEWFKKRPQTASEAAKRIAEFRQGCSALLLAEHQQLSAADQSWLKKHCREWSRSLDTELGNLEDNRNVVAALSETDKLVRQLSKELREQAAKS